MKQICGLYIIMLFSSCINKGNDKIDQLNQRIDILEQRLDSLNNPDRSSKPIHLFDEKYLDNHNSVSPGFSDKSLRCQAITKKGTRCKRTAGSGKFCWQHG